VLKVITMGPAGARDRIFISYRRDDARGVSGRVFDWLRIGFGRERVFRDVASIGAGMWRQKIEQALAASAACVAVIGRRWADSTNLPRLQIPNDMVRHELETALASGERAELTVIPLLVEDAQLSGIRKDQLPVSLQPLLGEWNVLALSESGWDDDTRRLIEAIAVATGLPVNPELEDWMALITGAQRGLVLARGAEAAGAVARLGQEQTLESLLHRAAESDPEERPALKAALAAMAAGDTLLAEESFERELGASCLLSAAAEKLAASERLRGAEAARNVAILAEVRGDLTKAVRHFQMALEANPSDLDASLGLGEAWISLGDLPQARGVFDSAIQQARLVGNQSVERWGLIGLGDVLIEQGDGPGALAAYRAGLMIADGLVKSEPSNTDWQRDLPVSHERIGDVLLEQGETAGALDAYNMGLAIREALGKRDPANTEWQRDLSVSTEKIGNVLKAQGDTAGALEVYKKSLAIREALVKCDLANPQWQRDLFVIKIKLVDLALAQGDGSGALGSYRASLAVAEGLAMHDPANTQWQRDLLVCHLRIGNVLLAQGDVAGALAEYRASLQISTALVKQNPANTRWQHDLSASYSRIGHALSVQGDGARALAAYQACLTIREALVKRDPTNLKWLRNLSASHEQIGDLLMAQGDGVRAREAYQVGLAISVSGSKHDPPNT
jgi:tetratricopeptide (TPR) repeat protein